MKKARQCAVSWSGLKMPPMPPSASFEKLSARVVDVKGKAMSRILKPITRMKRDRGTYSRFTV
ncbi:MAG: hypothetical protein JJE48_06235 [Actinobacteria bacterium]|nr:hypothetical protein [Actinomycetota bacterium]